MNEHKCKAKVRVAGLNWPTYKQCSRKAVIDGFCTTHHPDHVKEREKAAEAEFEKKMTAHRIERAAPLLLEALELFVKAGVGNSTDFQIQAEANKKAIVAIERTK